MMKLTSCLNPATYSRIWGKMGRTKTLSSDVMETPLNRCLTTFDMTLLGIGHMVGAGIYVLVGTVAKNTAGPAIIISFLIAGFASVLSALCYAEFGAQVPRAGSAYVYTYVTIGEFWAFIIGWNIVLEHMIGAASVARAWSGYIDSIFDGAISNASSQYLGTFHDSFLSSYPDPVAFFVTLAYCALLGCGVKGAAYFNSFFTLINLSVIGFVVGVGMFYSDFQNWNTSGGFAPYGTSGIVAGAAATFYAFVGFDSIATAGEEAINPAKSIPMATFISMSIVTVGYILVSAILTLIVPYYSLNPAAALPDAFAARGLTWAKYIISLGALCGMTTTLFGGLYSLPRCLYSMASDGLLFSWLAKVNERTQVPLWNLAFSGLITAIIAMLFDIEKLVEFMSIGTLMAYTIVSAAVIVLRYRSQPVCTPEAKENLLNNEEKKVLPPSEENQSIQEDSYIGRRIYPMFHYFFQRIPACYLDRVIPWALVSFIVLTSLFAAVFQWDQYFQGDVLFTFRIVLLNILMIFIAISIVAIAAHKEVQTNLTFKVPFVPFLPLLSIAFNIVLMLHLNPMTWLRLVVWVAIGLVLYFCYGIKHSTEGAVSDYTTLLVDTSLTGEKAIETAQSTLTKLPEVTSKILSAASNLSGTGQPKSGFEETDKEPILEKKPDGENLP